MLEPVKKAFGLFMADFYASLVPTTKAMQSYVTRGLDKSIVWAPARMVDAAEEMLSNWHRNDTNQSATTPANMPVMIVAMAKDYTPTGRDFTRQIADPVPVMIPTDADERVFNLRVIAGDVRAQVAIFAHDEPTAKSLASQLLLFLDATENRRWYAEYEFAGQTMDWPVQVESPDAPAMSIQTEAKNLTIMAVDLTLKCEIPLFQAYDTDDEGNPLGYPNEMEVQIEGAESA